MRRLLAFLFLLTLSVPFGAAISGCSKATAVQYCNGGDSGPQVGQTAAVTLSPNLATYGESLNYGEIGGGLSASAVDCKGSPVGVRTYTYATSNMNFADINPGSGQVCGGMWNRNTGGGIPDYTLCTAPINPPATTIAYVTATGDGVVSNPIAVYVHPIATSVIIGTPTPTASCAAAVASPTGDPSTNCCPDFTGQNPVTAPPYSGQSCLSQGKTGQLTSRVYANGTTNPSDNITCRVGHVNYSATVPSILTLDQNGVATAQQPGSTLILATTSNTGSGGAAGFFSTCPPASIVLTSATTGSTAPVSVNVNDSLPLNNVVTDINGVVLSGLNLTYNSTTPTTIPGGAGLISPQFPGTATIFASCQPPTCNPAPLSQIGYLGNGKPITSNGITATAPGTNATVLYIGSTQSQFLFPVDFSTSQTGSLIRLPYAPNSMVISNDGGTIYLGSIFGLMTVTTGNNNASSANIVVPGTVLAVSPDSSTIVVADTNRQTVSLVSSAGTVFAVTNGVGLRAQFSPDSQTVYIAAANDTLLVHTNFNGWLTIPTTAQYNDVAITVPAVGAFFATTTAVTEGRSYCSSTTQTSAGIPPTVSNSYFPVASDTATQTDRLAATNDGNHIVGASLSPTPQVKDIFTGNGGLKPTAACPMTVPNTYFTTTNTATPIAGIAATAITGVFPASNSALAFVTYTGTSGLLPLYVPSANGVTPGTVTDVTLSGGATTAPVSGVFATDNKTFYTGTSGDNVVHLITVNGVTATDTSTIAPKLPDANNNIATPNLLVQKPKRSVQ